MPHGAIHNARMAEVVAHQHSRMFAQRVLHFEGERVLVAIRGFVQPPTDARKEQQRGI
jgi:hypothetical protein